MGRNIKKYRSKIKRYRKKIKNMAKKYNIRIVYLNCLNIDWPERRAIFLGKTLNSHCASLPLKCINGYPAMD